eukprot:3069860-Pleurochrysis_carterae.AAC.1
MGVQLEQQLGAEGDAQHGEVARRDGLPDEHGRRRKREAARRETTATRHMHTDRDMHTGRDTESESVRERA